METIENNDVFSADSFSFDKSSARSFYVYQKQEWADFGALGNLCINVSQRRRSPFRFLFAFCFSKNYHCVKSFQIWLFSWSVFSCIRKEYEDLIVSSLWDALKTSIQLIIYIYYICVYCIFFIQRRTKRYSIILISQMDLFIGHIMTF